MTLPKVYSTGTASVANGATAVTGTGTAWANTVKADDVFRRAGHSVRVASVESNGALTLAEVWPGTSLVASAYEIAITYDGPEFQLRLRELIEDMSVVEANGRGLFYLFDTATTDVDPGDGELRFNNATVASATACYLDNLDADGAAVSTEIDSWDDGTSSVKGKLWVRSIASPAVFYAFNVTGSVVDGTGYRKLTIANVGGTGTLNAADEIMVFFAPKGDAGQSGSAGITLTYDTTTADADPGAGKFRLNNATPASATAVYINNVEALASADITALLDAWDDSTSTANGQVKFANVADPTIFLICDVTGTVVDGTGYRKLTIANVAGAGAFVNAAQFSLSFIPKGDKGDTGATGATGAKGAQWQGAWLTATTYVLDDVVSNGGSSYICIVAHTSGTFATDLAALKWELVAQKGADSTVAGPAGVDGTGLFSRVRVVATSNVDIAGGGLANGTTHDGVVVATNDLVLLAGQTAPAENGIYPVPASGAASRDTSFDTYDEHPGVYVSVMEGTANADTLWRCTSNKGGTLDTTALVFTKDVGAIVGATSINGGPLAGFRNHLLNGAMMVAQRGTSFTAATTPANSDDTYLLDRWILLSDGNDIVDVTQDTAVVPTNGLYALRADIETVNTKFGFLQVIEQKNCIGLIGETVTLSFKAKVSATTKLDNLKAAIVSWDGTADTVTSDIISAWGVEGTNPTLVANWTYENTPANLTPTTSYATYSVSAAVDTASTKNIGVFIWSDVTDTTLGDFLYITDVQLEIGSVATPFERRGYGTELALCQRYYWRGLPCGGLNFPSYVIGAVMAWPIMFPVTMRAAPTVSFSDAGAVYNSISSDTIDQPTPHGVRLLFITNTVDSNANVSFGPSDYISADAEL